MLLVALLATFLVRSEPTSVEGRLALFVERFVEGLAAVLVYHGVDRAFGDPTDRAGVLVALGGGGDRADPRRRDRAHGPRPQPRRSPCTGAWPTSRLLTSATLMGVSDMGVDGHGGMGLWGPVVFTIPLLAAWYSYEHLDLIRRTYDQTIRALGAAPELGGMVRDGHAERVASLSSRSAASSGSRATSSTQLETAALLHHLGQVCLDEPDDGRSPEPGAVARVGRRHPARHAAARAGRRHHRRREDAAPRQAGSRPSVMSGQILKVASAFDELVRRSARPRRASRSRRCPAHRSTSTTSGCSRRSRSCSTARGLLDDQLC